MSHAIYYRIRQIAAADLPQVEDVETGAMRAATESELLNMDIVPLHDDLYSCAEQYRGPHSQALAPFGPEKPGVIVSEGTLSQRHARLQEPHRSKILRARIIRTIDPSQNAVTAAAGNIQEQMQAIVDNVGDVTQPDGTTAPLVDLSHPDAVLAEAQRLVALQAGIPSSSPAPDPAAPPALERAVVPMVLVDPTRHLVEEDELIPHSWHGERL